MLTSLLIAIGIVLGLFVFVIALSFIVDHYEKATPIMALLLLVFVFFVVVHTARTTPDVEAPNQLEI